MPPDDSTKPTIGQVPITPSPIDVIPGQSDALGSVVGEELATPGSEKRQPIFVPHRIMTVAESPKMVFVVVDFLLALCIICLAVGFANPLQRLAPDSGAFRQSAAFSYKAAVISPTAVYPSGFVTTGEPIYSGLVNKVIIHFAYHFTTKLPHQIKGTIEVRALLLSQTDTWQQLATVSPIKAFTGDSASTVSSEGLDGLYALINSVSTQTGNANAAYTADIQLIVHVTGTVAGKPINTTFSPVVPFTVTRTAITIVVAATTVAPGATYVPPSAATELAATLNPEQLGSIPHLVPNFVILANHSFTVLGLRFAGFIFAALALFVGGVFELFRRRFNVQTKEAMVGAQANALMVPVESISVNGGVVVVPQFTDLVNLAQFLEQPILFEEKNGNRTYVVDDVTHRYIHRPKVTAPDDSANIPEPVHAIVGSRTSNLGSRSDGHRRTLLLRGTGGLVVLLTVVIVVTTFAASNNVPTSNVGTSNQPLIIAQLTPGGCASLALTSLVVRSGTFSSTRSRTLILAGPGVDTITDTGGESCIVGGGGTNTILGTSTDICPSGPTFNVATPCPTSTTTTTTTSLPVSNGVSTSATADNYGNYGGQERLAFNNVKSITALKITITVAQTQGITFGSQGNSFPGGSLTQSWSNPNGSIVFTYALAAGQSVSAGYPNGSVYAQYGGTGLTHAQSGDTWSVTSTSGGVVSRQSGTF